MKKINKVKNNKNLFLVTLTVVLIVFGALISQSRPEKTKVFRSSSIMNFSIEVPTGFKVTESLGSVSILYAGDEGEILIGRSGTNFDSLTEYLNDLNAKNRTRVINSQSETINSYQAFKQTLVNDDLEESNRVTYFIYVDGQVYSISTASESLYDELDQVARSFKYTGK